MHVRVCERAKQERLLETVVGPGLRLLLKNEMFETKLYGAVKVLPPDCFWPFLSSKPPIARNNLAHFGKPSSCADTK